MLQSWGSFQPHFHPTYSPWPLLTGRDNYPHAYNDYEHFTFAHAVAPYLEFPIMKNGSVFDGSTSPGADRVVLGSIAEDFSSAVYCAVITHDGQRKNGFVECADDTMNLRGKGNFGGFRSEGLHEKRMGGVLGGRKLVQRIELKKAAPS